MEDNVCKDILLDARRTCFLLHLLLCLFTQLKLVDAEGKLTEWMPSAKVRGKLEHPSGWISLVELKAWQEMATKALKKLTGTPKLFRSQLGEQLQTSCQEGYRWALRQALAGHSLSLGKCSPHSTMTGACSS